MLIAITSPEFTSGLIGHYIFSRGSPRLLREWTYSQFCTSVHRGYNFFPKLLLWNRNMETTIISMVTLFWVNILSKTFINLIVKCLNLFVVSGVWICWKSHPTWRNCSFVFPQLQSWSPTRSAHRSKSAAGPLVYTIKLTILEPPRPFPRWYGNCLPFKPGCGTVTYP